MPKFQVPGPGGKTMTMVSEDGVMFPEDLIEKMMPAKDLKVQLKWIKELDILDDDIIICAYPKAGTHWLWEVLVMLRKQKAEYETKVKENTMLEFRTVEDIAKIPSPRVLNTHMLPQHIPAGIKEKKCKIIHVMRNPKDIIVSRYYHMLALKKGHSSISEIGTFQDFVKQNMNPNGGVPTSVFKYYKAYEEFRKNNPDQHVLNVYFEDMKKQPEVEIKRISEFIGQPADDALVKEIANKCDFSNLKKANDDVKNDLTKGLTRTGEAIAYRKGVIGDWKNHFTVADNEAYDQLIDSQFKDNGLVFQYE